tara:strand:- start:142 stop:486 length:345 start_codon:yes stop_codon:yes gene_type:complete
MKSKSLAWIAAMVFGMFLMSTPAKAIGGKEVKIDQEKFEQLDAETQTEVMVVTTRLQEIFDTDRSDLTKEEKKALAEETKMLEERIDAINKTNDVVYISAGGLLLIILILLILL